MQPELKEPLDTYVESLAGIFGNQLRGIYLTGSIALGAYHFGKSDIDFTVVVAERPTDEQYRELLKMHKRIKGRYHGCVMDGHYITPDVLGKLPEDVPPVCACHDGKLRRNSYLNISLITWLTLKKHGVTLYGADARDLGFKVDMTLLKAKMLRNLHTYWAQWNNRIKKLWSIYGLASLISGQIEWGVLGVSRLYYTFREDDITSKEGAGRYLLQYAPNEFQRIIREALRIRCGEGRRQYISPFKRRRDAIRFIDYVISVGDESNNWGGIFSSVPNQRLQLGNSRISFAVDSVPEIPVLLKAQPKACRHPQDLSEAQSRVGRYTSFPPNDLIEPWKRDAQFGSKSGLRDLEGFYELLQQHLSRMGRGAMARQLPRC